MAITVSRLMDAQVLQGAKVVAGQEGLNHLVESVNMMDAPDIVEWIRLHQMLVTTLYNVKDNPDVLQRLIPELADRGCAAIGIKPRYFNIPSFMYSQANDLALPLIELPHDMPLGVLSHEITRTLLTRDFLTDRSSTGAENLWDMVMVDNGMDRIVTYFSREWKVPVALYGQDHQCLAVFLYGMTPSLLDALVAEAYAILRLHRWDVQACTLQGHTVERVPLVDGHCYYGDLMIIDRIQPVGKALAVGIRAVSAFYLKRYLKRQDWRLYLRKVAEALLANEYESNRVSNHDNGESFFIDAFVKAKAYGVVLAQVSLVESPQRLGNQWNPEESLQDEVLVQIEGRLQSQGWSVVAGIIDRQLVFLVADQSSPHIDSKTPQQRVADELEYIIENMVNSYSIHIRFSVGNFYSSIRHFAYSHQEARETMEVTQDKITIFRPQNVQNFLQHIPEQERKRFVEAVLGTLLILPPLERDPLLKTLQVFLSFQNQITETAKALFVHRNTVIYRLRKVEELLSKSLDDADDVLTLRLALLFLTNLEIRGETDGEQSSRLGNR